MIHGTPRDANSFSPVPRAARPSRTARLMLLSFMDRSRLPLRGTEFVTQLVTQVRSPPAADGCCNPEGSLRPHRPEVPNPVQLAAHHYRRDKPVWSDAECSSRET